MTFRDIVRVVLVVFTFLVVQETLILEIRIDGIHPDILVLLPIAAGVIGGAASGASMGFGVGLAADLFVPTPFGLSALVGCLVGFGVGQATVALDRSASWLLVVAALAGSAVYEVAYALLGSILGQPQMIHADLIGIVLVVSLGNALLVVPAVRLVGWALPAASSEGMPGSSPAAGMLR
jgi:rod shape-determining protein MreD